LGEHPGICRVASRADDVLGVTTERKRVCAGFQPRDDTLDCLRGRYAVETEAAHIDARSAERRGRLTL
jgi:hypothetical protein